MSNVGNGFKNVPTTATSFGAVVASAVGPGATGISICAEDSAIYSPKIPYIGVIPQGLAQGKSILIKGLVLSSRDKRFTVNLACGLQVEGEKRDDVALHVDIRFDENTLVLNTLTGNVWGSELRYPNPVRRGQVVELRILAQADSFMVAVNGENICEYGYRLALHSVKTLHVKGCVKVDVIQYEQTNSNAQQSHEFGISDHAVSSAGTIYRPPVPFTCGLPGKLVPGKSRLSVTGTPRLHASVFFINLKCGNDIALHISVRFTMDSEKTVVLNSRRNGVYEKEDRYTCDYFPFVQGGTFDVAIAADKGCFIIRVDGRHYVDFPHRFQPDAVDALEIEGDVQLQQIQFHF